MAENTILTRVKRIEIDSVYIPKASYRQNFLDSLYLEESAANSFCFLARHVRDNFFTIRKAFTFWMRENSSALIGRVHILRKSDAAGHGRSALIP
jgi:hypothetical protein